jgi:hypothetical protein
MYSAIADEAAVKLLAVYTVVLSCCFHASAVKTSCEFTVCQVNIGSVTHCALRA